MKNFIKYLPVFLLLSYTILCFFRVPDFSDSFIIVALASLNGAFWWKEIHSTTINIPKKVIEEVETLRLKKEISELSIKIEEMNITPSERILYNQIRQLRKELEVVALEKDMLAMKSLREGIGNGKKENKFQF